MKRNRIVLAAMLAAAVSGIVLAGQVYDRTAAIALGAATGTAKWTNTAQYAALKLVRIWDVANLAAANTVTVKRILYGTTVTQACASVEFASGNAGNSATFTAGYLKWGDILLFTSTIATGSSVYVEYEVQQH